MPTLPELLRPLLLPISSITATKLRRGLAAPLLSTKFGGTPYAEEEGDWPTCGACDEPLTFIFQCNLADCPHQKSQGLFTFYYCHECSPWGDDDLDNAWSVRRYSAPNQAAAFEDESSSDHRTTPCSVTMAPIQALPDWETINEIAPDVALLAATLHPNAPWDAYEKAVKHLLGFEPEPGSRIGGYPWWVQSCDIPDCPECGKSTRLLAQIESEQAAGLMWGDLGCVYLFECPDHPNKIQMRMQCH